MYCSDLSSELHFCQAKVRQKGQLVIFQIITLTPPGIKQCFVFGLGFHSRGLPRPQWAQTWQNAPCPAELLGLRWEGDGQSTSVLAAWGKSNKVPRALCVRQPSLSSREKLASAQTALRVGFFGGCMCTKDRESVLTPYNLVYIICNKISWKLALLWFGCHL